MGIQLPELVEQEAQDFEVLKCNVPVLEAFFILDGCAWQYTGMGDLIGLDYYAAQVIWSYAGMAIDAETFRGVMLFSRTVVDEMNKKRKRK